MGRRIGVSAARRPRETDRRNGVSSINDERPRTSSRTITISERKAINLQLLAKQERDRSDKRTRRDVSAKWRVGVSAVMRGET